MTVTPARWWSIASSATALVVCGALAGCSDDSSPEAAATTSTTAVVASATTVAPLEQATAVAVAEAFLDAYGDLDADRALTYLTEDAVATGGGHAGSWGSTEGFRLNVAMNEAQRIEQMLTGCEESGDSAAATTVRCTFDMHAYHSDEIGLGPYTDNYWDLVVRDGKITSALATWAYITNGFSNELWVPFQTWVSSTHPEDFPAMYLGASVLQTEESVALWRQRIREWAETKKAGPQ